MAFELTTPILSAEKKELAVTARYYSYQDSTPTRKRYHADLFFNNEKIGDMEFEYVGQGDDKKYNFLSSDFNLPYINIVNMQESIM